MTYLSTILADSPAAFWRMNEASGLPQDSSGNARHCTAVFNTGVYHQASPITSDPSDYSILLSGNTGFSSPDGAWFDLGSTFSIEAWVKKTANGVFGCLVHKGSGAYLFEFDDTNHVRIGRQGVGVICSSTTTITDTSWHHVVATCNGATGAKIYVDSVDVSGSFTNQAPVDTATVLSIGVRNDGSGDPFNGYLDEVAIYPTVLSGAQVLAHYNAALASSPGMAPTTPILDNFNRSNRGLAGDIASSGYTWSSTDVGGGVIGLQTTTAGDALQAAGAGSGWLSNLPDTAADCETYATLKTQPSNDYYEQLYLRGSSFGTAGWNCYVLIYSWTYGWDIRKVVAGTPTGLLGWQNIWVPTPGDKVIFKAIGNHLYAYKYTSAAWSALIDVVDSTYSAGGKIGISISNGATAVEMDDWGGGSIVTVTVDDVLPDADVTTTGWTTTPLFSKVNDASDATVISATAV